MAALPKQDKAGCSQSAEGSDGLRRLLALWQGWLGYTCKYTLYQRIYK